MDEKHRIAYRGSPRGLIKWKPKTKKTTFRSVKRNMRRKETQERTSDHYERD